MFNFGFNRKINYTMKEKLEQKKIELENSLQKQSQVIANLE